MATMTFPNVMIDIEGLGEAPNGVILTIGAVRFDFGLEDGLIIPDFLAPLESTSPLLVCPAFYETITISSSLSAGLRVDGRTIAWWLGHGKDAPDDAVRMGLFNPPPLNLRDVLRNFRHFLVGHKSIWAKPTAYDLTMLHESYRAIKSQTPWRWRDAYDFRSYAKGVPPDPVKLKRYGPKHHALWDACFQATQIRKIYQWKHQHTKSPYSLRKDEDNAEGTYVG